MIGPLTKRMVGSTDGIAVRINPDVVADTGNIIAARTIVYRVI